MRQSGDYKRFFQLSLDMLCIAGFDGYFKELNPAWEKALGFTVAELLAKPYLAFIHPDDRSKTAVQAEVQTQGQDAVNFENRYLCKDGSYRWFLWQATQIPGEELIFAIARDVTENKKLQEALRAKHGELELGIRERTRELVNANEELRRQIAQREEAERDKEKLRVQLGQAQKMEAIGRLAGGVAHDFNNLLTAISGYSHFLLNAMSPEDPKRADIEEIRAAGRRAASLTRQLLAFSRQQVLQPRLVQLNDIVGEMERMLRRLIGEDIALDARMQKDLGLVLADPGQLEQVVMNLVVNARDAMPKGGKLTLETANVELGRDYAATHLELRPGPHVMLAVSDTGLGMDKETQARIFEPFFTTKEQGKGTGLGLATVYGIVKQSRGSLFVYSEPGRGAAFKLYFPRAQGVAGPAKRAGPAAKPARGTETILLVEDDESVRKFVHRALSQNGYTVLLASRAEEALRLCELHGKTIDLLLTDIVMPGMRGDELARRVAAARPGIKVILVSGYTEAGLIQNDLAGAGMNFIQKPLDPETLALRVREILDGGP